MAGVSVAPLAGRVTDKFVAWFVTLVATTGSLVFYSIQLGAGGLNVAAVVIACFGIDALRQTQQVSITTGVLSLEPKARSRLNAVLIISVRHVPSRTAHSQLIVKRSCVYRSSSGRSSAHPWARQSSTRTGGAPPQPSP